MIEEKIDSLINSVDQLTAVIDRLWQQKGAIREMATKPDIVPEPKAAPVLKEAPKKEKVEKKKEKETTPTVKELEQFCLKLVRKQPDIKNKIKAAIKAAGGDLIKDIAAEKLPELKVALEDIVA